MKKLLEMLALGLIAFVIVFAAVYGIRLFSQATTPINLVSPKAGITCATMSTSDGAAISCWKD